MKQHLWSNPKAQWEGFQPVSYWLENKVLQLPLTMKSQDGAADLPTTVGDVYRKVEDKQITAQSLSGGLSIDTEIETTDGMKLLLEGKDFNRRILEMMLKFRAEGINPFDVVLFYYDKDSNREMPDNAFSFFAVHNDKIIQERLTFFDHDDSGFDPSVFAKPDHSNAIWGNEGEWDEAQARFWYRKFYSETRTGQLMALRPDKPSLFFQHDPAALDIVGALGAIARSLNSIRLLLWVLVILAILTFILRWK